MSNLADIRNNCYQGRKGNGKKRSAKPTKAVTPLELPEEPALTADGDAETGRPGQAEGLLASRRQRQVAAAQTKMKSADGPVPVTPDSVAGTTSSGFDDSS